MDSAPAYAAPGWLLYGRQGVLVAQRFDADALKTIGEPVSLVDEPTSILDPATSFTAGQSSSVSMGGTLAYFSAPSTNTIASWYDTTGAVVGELALPPGHYETGTISPDGTQAVLVRSTSPSESALWLVDLASGNTTPISSGAGRNDSPVWSPDSKRVVFAADRDGPQDFFVKTVADAAPEQPLHRSSVPFGNPAAWSPDGQWIIVTQLDAGTAQNAWLLPSSGKGDMQVLASSPLRDNGGPVSPDGRWVAYTSEQLTGRLELFVQSFPEPGRRVQVSQQGAAVAWWTLDGRQLLFLGDDLHSLWRVDIETGPTLRTGTPNRLTSFPADIVWIDATPDRKRFLAIAPERGGPGSITIVQNWLAAMK